MTARLRSLSRAKEGEFSLLVNLNGKRLILASGSPRRSQLLKLIGLDFEVIDSKVNERDEEYTIPEVHVLELAQKKAQKVAENITDGIIIGADTIVVLDNEILGKPDSATAAQKMLRQLSGQTHRVYTGFALIERPSGTILSDYEQTQVTFREIADDEIAHYVATESPLDKAGAYGIQDQSAVFVSRIDGCFYNVMGFPLAKFYWRLQSFLKSNDLK
ncbi:MAG TPA: Maf family protein [bacterium]